MSRPVILGKKVLFLGVATHWALKIGDTWYEVEGASKSQSAAPNKIVKRSGRFSANGASPFGGGTVGSSNKSDREIEDWWKDWLRQHPKYDLFTSNCQMFATELAYWACKGACTMPPMESGGYVGGTDGGRFEVSSDCALRGGVSSLHREAYLGPLSASVAGPSAGYDLRVGEQGLGAFADASWVRADARLLGVCAHLDLNANTGIGVRNGNAEASLLGVGLKVGLNGLCINTPLGGLSFGSGRA